MKGLEDVGIKYDGTVRTGNNIILQYIYSDSIWIKLNKRSKLKNNSMGDKRLRKGYFIRI